MGGGSRDTGLVTVDNLFENPARYIYLYIYICSATTGKGCPEACQKD